jgi:membrane protein implicated in regulation of membrane protease activity
MADWMNWLAMAGVLVILELFTGTFYLLMVAIGLGVGGAAALLGAGTELQMVLAAIVGVAATILLRRSRLGMPERGEPARDPNVNIDIGQHVAVPAWDDGTARVMYRGALWDVELAPHAKPQAGNFKIVEVRGSRLVLSNS